MAKEDDGHRHLAVVAPKVAPAGAPTVPRWRRWLVLGLMVGAMGLFACSFTLSWWHFTLYAPQYPHGLQLDISLTGMGGDAHEIDMLNHYIGMGHLADAAPFERHYAAWGVASVALLVLGLTFAAGRKLGKLIVVPALMFPLGFVADAFYWLYHFGHTLDPHAPIHLPSFTPEMFGNGQIGQFLTFASPSAGFWVAVAGAAMVVVATFFRQRSVCAVCSRADVCGALCVSGFVGKERPPQATT